LSVSFAQPRLRSTNGKVTLVPVHYRTNANKCHVVMRSIRICLLFLVLTKAKLEEEYCSINGEECKEETDNFEEEVNRNENEEEAKNGTCIPFSQWKFGPKEPSIFIIVANGRLGNHLTAFTVIQVMIKQA